MLLYLFIVSGCRVTQMDTHNLELVQTMHQKGALSGWIFADLIDNHNDVLISLESSSATLHSIFVKETSGKILSQINLPYKVRSLNVLTDKRDNSHWLFYAYNDQRAVFLDAVSYTWKVPLQRENRRFESIPRTDQRINDPRIEYYGQVSPKYLDDIDGDGKQELLCLELDGFNANPRGIVLYDFDTGKIKWRYEMAANVNTLVWDDLDHDGTKEILFSTQAVKNTTAVINGIDDTGCYLGVLSVQGKLLFLERQFEGYGLINLAAQDVDNDQKVEIYAVNSTWGNELHKYAAAEFAWNGKRLIRQKNLESPAVLERNQIPDFLQKTSGKEAYNLLLVDKNKGLTIYDTDLKQVASDYPGNVSEILAIGNLDQDGDKELVILTNDDYIDILDNHFIRRARLKNPIDEDGAFGLKIVDTGIDSKPVIAIGSAREMRYYEYGYLSPWVLIRGLFIVLSPYLVFILLISFIIYEYIAHLRRRVPFLGVNYLREGIMLLSNERKIVFSNRSTFVMAADSKDTACHDLKLSYPRLHQLLLTFNASRLPYLETRETLFPDKQDNQINVMMFKIKSLGIRYMIIFDACPAEIGMTQEKMQWADIARRLSHHVRRHITNIILSVEALNSDEDARRREYYRIIRDEIEKVRIFTHSFQRFTELKDYQLKLQDIIPSIEHCLARAQVPERVKVVKNWGLESVEAYIEPIRFEEAVSNMINNALEAMPEGGILHISAKQFPLAVSPQGALKVLVEIEDNGKGIPAKYMEDIWKPFFTTNQSGTGIGIPESRKIIESMGGVMDIQSEEGLGTTVSFWLRGTDAE